MTEAKWLADQQGAKWMISHLLMVRGDSIAPLLLLPEWAFQGKGNREACRVGRATRPPTNGDRFNPTPHGNALGRCQKNRQSDG